MEYQVFNQLELNLQIELLIIMRLVILVDKASEKLGSFIIAFKANTSAAIKVFKKMAQGHTSIVQNLDELADILIFAQKCIDSFATDWIACCCASSLDFDNFAAVVFQSLQICWAILKKIEESNLRVELVNSICARSWILFYHILSHLFGNEDREKSQNIVAEMMIWAHEQLGQKSACCGDNGALLQLNIKHISTIDPYYHYEVYQSFYCLFGTDITANSTQELLNHHSNNSEFDKDASEMLYAFIQPVLEEKINSNNFRTLGKDVKDCLEMITKLFNCPPVNNSNYN